MESSCSVPVAPAGLTVQVCFPAARASVLDNLNRQREEGKLCDLSIQVQGQVFRAHRCVLAASSPYFHDQVLLKNVTTVSLPSVLDPVAFESVLSSAYTGQLSIVQDDIVNYVTVASFLQMWHIVDKCTDILKRARPSTEGASTEAAAAANHTGSASRQQSPSSTDCLYLEREGRKKEKKPDVLPPLATWRRPQQFPRWERQRPSSALHSADSQLDPLPGYQEADYSSCEESWVPKHTKNGPLDGAGQHSDFHTSEAVKQNLKQLQRGAPQSTEKNRGSEEKRRNERREIEADEGVGEEVAEKKGALSQTSHCDLHTVVTNNVERHAANKSNVEEGKEKFQRNLPGNKPPVDGQKSDGALSPASVRGQWHSVPWPQQDPRTREGEAGKDDDEDNEEDFECFPDETFSGDTYDEIEDGTGQVSQRPLVPESPDVVIGGSEGNWPSNSSTQGGSLTPTHSRHLSPASAAFPPSSSPPTPSSSSSVNLPGPAYSGKVHFCHCGKAYTLKSMRDRHVKMQHLNLRPFVCPVCTKSFKMKHHLTKHLKTHGGLRPYECGLCGKKVIWRDSFLRHQARCQRQAAGPNSSHAASAPTEEESGYGYGFEDEGAFLAMGGQVKVEEVDFQGEMEEAMGGLLSGVSGIVDELRTQSQNVGPHVFKEEANESFCTN
ncbi:uncharacterized protein zbtb22a isoform 1-T2 [Synchiropus picturatus]